jgi:hypothetical protein
LKRYDARIAKRKFAVLAHLDAKNCFSFFPTNCPTHSQAVVSRMEHVASVQRTAVPAEAVEELDMIRDQQEEA